jgi:uncharacterized protein (DUF2267 family)
MDGATVRKKRRSGLVSVPARPTAVYVERVERVGRDGDEIVIDYDGFVTSVAQLARIGWQDAERATRAVLETLAERIAAGEAKDIQAQLPSEVAAWLGTSTPAEGFDVDEFLRRVAARADTEVRTAERYAGAVLATLARAISDDELHDLAAELPRELRPLLTPAPVVREVPAMSVVVELVEERTGLDEDRARRALDAVLETLAERIAGGEVDDLVAQLPAELGDPLRRGSEASGGKAQRMSLQQFLARVAERERVSTEEAADHARAVFRALRELLPERELRDVMAELPRDYDVLLGH